MNVSNDGLQRFAIIVCAALVVFSFVQASIGFKEVKIVGIDRSSEMIFERMPAPIAVGHFVLALFILVALMRVNMDYALVGAFLLVIFSAITIFSVGSYTLFPAAFILLLTFALKRRISQTRRS